MFLKISKKIKQDKRGSALILTMTILVAGILAFSSIVSVSLMQRSSSSKARSSAEALQMADSCLEWFLMKYYSASSNAIISDIGSINNEKVFSFSEKPNNGADITIGGETYDVSGNCELYLIDKDNNIISNETKSLSEVQFIKSVGMAGFGEDKTNRAVQVGLSDCPKVFIDDRVDDYEEGVDREYEAVEIGDQCWMAENLRIGDSVCSSGTSCSENMSDDGNIERYCYNNDSNNCDTYGGLYQWDEAMQYTETAGAPGICPDGWHIPSDEEWKTLEMELGMSQEEADGTSWRGTNEGSKMAGEKDLWLDGALEKNIDFGLSGLNFLPAGYRNTGGSFVSLGTFAYFWSLSESGISAWSRGLVSTRSTVNRFANAQANGFSVRCLKD